VGLAILYLRLQDGGHHDNGGGGGTQADEDELDRELDDL